MITGQGLTFPSDKYQRTAGVPPSWCAAQLLCRPAALRLLKNVFPFSVIYFVTEKYLDFCNKGLIRKRSHLYSGTYKKYASRVKRKEEIAKMSLKKLSN